MVDIYNEVAFIKNVLGGNLSYKWERDMTLLVRFYHAEGILKKKQVKEKMKEKLLHSNIGYEHELSFKRFNSVFEKAWKNKDPLREIHYIELPKEVLDWFLGLIDNPDFQLTNDEVAKYKKSRKVVIKKNKALNWDRVKYLFTLYIHTLVEKTYLDHPGTLYLHQRGTQQRFKQDAGLTSFNMIKERNYMYDLGLLGINYNLGVSGKFINEYDVFNTPITDEDRILLYAGEPPTGDLYNIGEWLSKQKFGSFVCQECGKEFAHYNNTAREKARKYCKECAPKVNYKTKKTDSKIIKANENSRWCCDCGNLFFVNNNKDKRRIRCNCCQEKFNTLKNAEYQKKYREKHKKVRFSKIIKKVSKPLKNQVFKALKCKNKNELIWKEI